MSVAYLASKIVEAKQTKVPQHGTTRDGYSVRSGAPTSLLVRLDGEKRWRRVYACHFSNAGTAFLRIKGVSYVVDAGTAFLRIKGVAYVVDAVEVIEMACAHTEDG